MSVPDGVRCQDEKGRLGDITARRALLESLLPCDRVFDGDSSRPVPSGAAVLTPTRRADSHAAAPLSTSGLVMRTACSAVISSRAW